MAETKIRHHFMPSFYLRGFAGDDGLLWVYDKKSDRVFSNVAENVGYAKHYHSFNKPDGSRDSGTFEEYFSATWEGPASRVIAAISDGCFPSGKDRALLASFVGLCFTRSPNHRVNVENVVASDVRTMARMYAADAERFQRSLDEYERVKGEKLTDDPEELRLDILKGDYRIQPTPQVYLKMFVKHGLAFGAVVERMSWTFFRTAPRSFYLTSDNPIFLHDPTIDRRSFYSGTGLLNRNVQLTFPISRRVALLAAWRERAEEGFRDWGAAEVDALNTRTIMATNRFAYACEHSDKVRRWVSKFARTRPTISFGAGPTG